MTTCHIQLLPYALVRAPTVGQSLSVILFLVLNIIFISVVCSEEIIPVGLPHGRLLQHGSDVTPLNVTDNDATSAGPLAWRNIKVLEYLYTEKAVFEEGGTGLV